MTGYEQSGRGQRPRCCLSGGVAPLPDLFLLQSCSCCSDVLGAVMFLVQNCSAGLFLQKANKRDLTQLHPIHRS
jgi:hypothetical protein